MKQEINLDLQLRSNDDQQAIASLLFGAPIDETPKINCEIDSSAVGKSDNRQTNHPEGGTTNREERFSGRVLRGQRVA